MHRCFNCMNEFDKSMDTCPHCGADYRTVPDNYRHLTPGTLLNDRYVVGYAKDTNSVFVTYNAWDNDNNEKVYINEFLPNNFAERSKGKADVVTKSGDAEDKYYAGLKAFADECQDLINVDHNDIINGFDANNTYYVVRKIIKGTSLAEVIDDDYEITNEYARRVIVAVLKAVEPVHDLGIIHGNITSDNIIIDENGSVIITDFGFCGYMARVMAVYTNEGYSPVEEYEPGVKLTTAVDIYSIAAVFYELITGEIPVSAQSRAKQDTLIPISEVKGVTLRTGVCNAIMNALNIKADNRTQDVESFYDEIKDKNNKRRWEKHSTGQKPKNDFYKKKSFWLKTLIYIMIAIMFICGAVIAFEVSAIKKDVNKEKQRENEVSTEALPDENKSIFDIFESDNSTEETTEDTENNVDDEVESGGGILAIFN